MGNTVDLLRDIPRNLSKSSHVELDALIGKAIVSCPWSEHNGLDHERTLSQTVQEMRKQGFRPITAEEYHISLTNGVKRISLWIPLGKLWIPSCLIVLCLLSSFILSTLSLEGKFPLKNDVIITLPSSAEELSERIMQMQASSNSNSGFNTFSQGETEEWATQIDYACSDV
jgi:hypothetical protein